MEIDHDRLRAWLSHYGVPHYRIHCSGHAMPQDLIERVAPKKLALNHTEEPELSRRYISDLSVETLTPTKGEIVHL